MPTSTQPVPCFLEYSQEEKSSPATHGALSVDKIYPCFEEKQIMLENTTLQKQASQTVPRVKVSIVAL